MPSQFGHVRFRESALPRSVVLAAVLCGHGALAGWLLHAVDQPVTAPRAVRMDVRLVEFRAPVRAGTEHIAAATTERERTAPVAQPDPVPPEPEPLPEADRVPKPEPRPRQKPQQEPGAERKPEPKPELRAEERPAAAEPAAVASAATAVVANAEAPGLRTPAAAIPETAASTASAFVEARFEADYLRNPAPVYPPMSRRRGEQGEVLLLVAVSADGRPEHVEIRRSSGHRRLDEAALRAVREWRFVPARRGGRAVAANVVVPIAFRLST